MKVTLHPIFHDFETTRHFLNSNFFSPHQNNMVIKYKKLLMVHNSTKKFKLSLNLFKLI